MWTFVIFHISNLFLFKPSFITLSNLENKVLCIYIYIHFKILFVINIPIGNKKLLRNIWFQKMLKASENQVIIWDQDHYSWHLLISSSIPYATILWSTGVLSLFTGRIYDESVDVFSFGIVLCEVLLVTLPTSGILSFLCT